MKFVIVFAALFAVALAAPNKASESVIVRSDSDVQPDGFKFDTETSDGSKHHAEGQLKDKDTDHEAIVVHGSYSFVADDGVAYTVDYTADENGFQPHGAHIPVA